MPLEHQLVGDKWTIGRRPDVSGAPIGSWSIAFRSTTGRRPIADGSVLDARSLVVCSRKQAWDCVADGRRPVGVLSPTTVAWSAKWRRPPGHQSCNLSPTGHWPKWPANSGLEVISGYWSSPDLFFGHSRSLAGRKDSASGV